MKAIILILTLAALARGADIQLADGREFQEFQIVSQTATTVLIRHSGGAAKVEKRHLPEEVRALYPVDEEGAKAEALENEIGRKKYAAQRRAVEERRQKQHAAFIAEVKKRQDTSREKQIGTRAAKIAAEHEAQKRARAETGTSVIRADVRMNTPRSMSTEVSTVELPPAAKRATYSVDYEIIGSALALNIRSGLGTQHHELQNINVTGIGWSRRVLAKTGDRVYLWAAAGGAGGDEFKVRIRIDGIVVREAVARGTNVQAEVSHTVE